MLTGRELRHDHLGYYDHDITHRMKKKTLIDKKSHIFLIIVPNKSMNNRNIPKLKPDPTLKQQSDISWI